MFREKCYQMALFGNSQRERAARSGGLVSVCQDWASPAGLLFSHHAAKPPQTSRSHFLSPSEATFTTPQRQHSFTSQPGCTCILCGGERDRKKKKLIVLSFRKYCWAHHFRPSLCNTNRFHNLKIKPVAVTKHIFFVTGILTGTIQGMMWEEEQNIWGSPNCSSIYHHRDTFMTVINQEGVEEKEEPTLFFFFFFCLLAGRRPRLILDPLSEFDGNHDQRRARREPSLLRERWATNCVQEKTAGDWAPGRLTGKAVGWWCHPT